MPLFKGKLFHSPAFFFAVYVVIGSLAVFALRFWFHGEAAPLPGLAARWRMNMWLLDVIALFPALAFSALVIPFGVGMRAEGGRLPGFSADLFRRCFAVPVITAIVAAGIYALLFFLALPLAQDAQRNMRADGEIYRMARARARAHYEAGEWVQASHFVGIADGIWGCHEFDRYCENCRVRHEVEVHAERIRFAGTLRQPAAERPLVVASDLPGHWDPVDTFQATEMAWVAYGDGRVFDAHWLATLGWRLARPGSPEAAEASRLAARSWNLIETQRPSAGAERARELFELKLDGYQAYQSGDWVRAYYIFLEHDRLAPGDPDVRNFLARSEQRLGEVAFFVDEMGVAVGHRVAGAVFSLPADLGATGQGRAVLRLASLSSTRDFAFGVGLEYMVFDHQSRIVLHLRAPYAKFVPYAVGGPEARQQVVVLMRALDRGDPGTYWEPTVEVSAGEAVYRADMAQIALGIGYDKFLMLSRMQQDVSAMHVGELLDASRMSADTGYIPQVFEAEILNRLGSGLFFLPVAIAAIAVGWYLRARRGAPRYFFIPMLFVLPVVFNGLAYIIRAGLNVIGVSLTLALGFPLAAVVFSAILAVAFFCSLFLLASQRG